MSDSETQDLSAAKPAESAPDATQADAVTETPAPTETPSVNVENAENVTVVEPDQAGEDTPGVPDDEPSEETPV